MNRILVWMMVAMIGIAAFGCGDDDKGTGPSKKDIVGLWTSASGHEIVFYSDGTFAYQSSSKGTWSLRGNLVHVVLESGEIWEFTFKDGFLIGGWEQIDLRWDKD